MLGYIVKTTDKAKDVDYYICDWDIEPGKAEVKLTENINDASFFTEPSGLMGVLLACFEEIIANQYDLHNTEAIKVERSTIIVKE